MADTLKFRAILFDLDGTLLDTLDDLADSMNAALTKQGFPAHPVEAYRYFVGDGIRELVRRVLPSDKTNHELITANIAFMSEEYEKRWNCKTKPYAGMEAALDELTDLGIRMAVLSNKPDSFTKKMIPALLPRWRFQPVIGARPGVPVKPDPQAALEIAEILQVRPDQILYAGDTAIDMKTANAAGMYAVGVSWGFRTVDELERNGAKRIIHQPGELLEALHEKMGK